MIKKILLLGNPNVGKSVVFSRITGVHVISANYPGTTLEIMKGQFDIVGENIEVIDLPGIYSLTQASKAEEVALNILMDTNKAEAIVVNVIDATNLERNLYLTLQLIEEGFRVVVCLNMCDEAKHRGVSIDRNKLEELLKVPVIFTCAVTGAGIKDLIDRLNEAKPVLTEEITADERWKEIGRIIGSVQKLAHRHHTFVEMIEDISVSPFAGILIGLSVIAASFKIVRFLGEVIIKHLSDPVFFNVYRPFLEKLSGIIGKESLLHHILIGDLIGGRIDFQQSLGILTTAPYIEFGMVLPYVAAFYIVLSILEDVGYLPRLAILLDNILHRLGLHGYAIIPVLLGFGCNIPGILSTRMLESKRERFIAATLISIGVPCAALQAMIFALLGKISGYYVFGAYLVLFAIWLMLGIILNISTKGPSPELLLEIPPYRFPPINVMLKKIYFRVKGFLIEAVPVVMGGVLVVNLLLYFKAFDIVTNIFRPLVTGLFGLPKETTIALAIGFIRKDVAAGMLMPLGLTPKQLFISVILLSVSFPCIATFTVLLKELGLKDFIKSTIIMIITGISAGVLLNIFILKA